MKDFNCGSAIWNQRFNLRQNKQRLRLLADAVDNISDSSLAQYVQMYAIALAFKPDLIIEFGRGMGNSTAVFTEAANQLDNCKVISICLSTDWQNKTASRIVKFVPKNWFDKLDTQVSNILDIKFKDLIKTKKRVLFLWDAHGWDIAEYVLGEVLPRLWPLEHLVLIHDISYFDPNAENAAYGSNGIWKGYPGDEISNPPYLVLNSMISPFEEMVALYDFASRNQLQIYGVDEEIRRFFEKDQKAGQKIKKVLGKQMANSTSSFQWFTLNSLPQKREIYFPRYQKQKKQKELHIQVSFSRRRSLSAGSQFIESRPLVSIVTPSYNSGKYIEECIQSVLTQDYPYVEHVIQDGGSGDHTLKILKKYSGPKYKNKVKWVIESDNGQSDGLDKAIKRASGEVILVLNADDILLPYACSWGVLHLKLNPDIAVVYGDEYIIDEQGKTIREFTGPRYDYERVLCVEIVPAAQTAFIRRNYFEKVGLGADSTLSTCPDYEMWVRIGAKFDMKYVSGFISKYRWHDQSEGQKPEMILKMIAAKKQVMDRIFNSSKTPKRIKKLRKRAYAGVEIWGAMNHMQLKGSVLATGKLVISSFLHYPPNIWKYRKLIPGGMISFTKFAFMRLVKRSLQLKKRK